MDILEPNLIDNSTLNKKKLVVIFKEAQGALFDQMLVRQNSRTMLKMAAEYSDGVMRIFATWALLKNIELWHQSCATLIRMHI